MTVVSKKSCISISFCYFYSFSSVNFRCREGEYFNRYVRIQTEYQSTVYCPKNKKNFKKRVVLQNLHIACWKCWLCYWVSWNLLSHVYRLILLEAWLLNWLLTVPSTVFVIQLQMGWPWKLHFSCCFTFVKILTSTFLRHDRCYLPVFVLDVQHQKYLPP